MAKQLHKRFSTEEVKMLLRKYLNEKVELVYILEILKIKRSRFFEILKEYRKDPDGFSIDGVDAIVPDKKRHSRG